MDFNAAVFRRRVFIAPLGHRSDPAMEDLALSRG